MPRSTALVSALAAAALALMGACTVHHHHQDGAYPQAAGQNYQQSDTPPAAASPYQYSAPGQTWQPERTANPRPYGADSLAVPRGLAPNRQHYSGCDCTCPNHGPSHAQAPRTNAPPPLEFGGDPSNYLE